MRPTQLAIAAVLAIATTPASAKDVTVLMKNRGEAGIMVFEPSFVKAAVGDVIHFVPADSGHNAETIPGLLPAGSTPVKGAMNKPVTLKLTRPGLYGIKCMPHYSMGMVALIQAGPVSPTSLAAARAVSLPPSAAKRLAPAFAQVK